MVMLYLHESDPITLALVGAGVGGLAGAGSAAYSLFGPKPAAPSMPAPPPPSQSPSGSAAPAQSTGPNSSFLAAAAAPGSNQLGSKSLLGQ